MLHCSMATLGTELFLFGGKVESDGEQKASNHLYCTDVLELLVSEDAFSASWREVKGTGDIPSPRYGHSSVVCQNRMLVFGGQCGDKIFGDAFIYDFDTKIWSQILSEKTPGVTLSKRTFHASVVLNSKAYIFGGFNGVDYLNDLHCYDMVSGTWQQIKLPEYQVLPQPRLGAAVACMGSEAFLLHGGETKKKQESQPDLPIEVSCFLDDFWIFDKESTSWLLCKNFKENPSARKFHAMVEVGEKTVEMVGGIGENESLSVDVHYVIDTDAISLEAQPVMSVPKIFSSTTSTENYPVAIENPEGKPPPKKIGGVPEGDIPQTTVDQECADPVNSILLKLDSELELRDDAGSDTSEFSESSDFSHQRSHSKLALAGDSSKEDGDTPTWKDLYQAERSQREKLTVNLAEISENLANSIRRVAVAEEEVSYAQRRLAYFLDDEKKNSSSTKQRAMLEQLSFLWYRRTRTEQQISDYKKTLNDIDQQIEEIIEKLSDTDLKNKRPTGSDWKNSRHDKEENNSILATSLLPKKLVRKNSKKSITNLTHNNSDEETEYNSSSSGNSVTFDEEEIVKKAKRIEDGIPAKRKKSTSRRATAKLSPQVKPSERRSSVEIERKEPEKKEERKTKTGTSKDKVKDDIHNFQKAKVQLGNLLLRRQTREHMTAVSVWKPTLNLTIVERCCEFLETKLSTVGLFRIPGSASAVDRIYSTFEHPSGVFLGSEDNPHNVAEAFKLWLRSLTNDPIIPYALFDEVVIAADEEKDQKGAVVNIVKKLPSLNLSVLERIIRFLRILTLKSEENKMDIQNISIVFGTTLVRIHPDKESPTTVLLTNSKTALFIYVLLENYTEIFATPMDPTKGTSRVQRSHMKTLSLSQNSTCLENNNTSTSGNGKQPSQNS